MGQKDSIKFRESKQRKPIGNDFITTRIKKKSRSENHLRARPPARLSIVSAGLNPAKDDRGIK